MTLWWIFVTQWFFGPPIIDRGFLLTGGQCDLVELADAGKVDMDNTRQFVTGVACKAVGGKWKGGHDISGHVFLLVLGSMFIFEEVLHVVLTSSRAKEERTIFMNDGAVESADVEADTPKASGPWTLGAKIVLGVAGLSLYMLLMTAAYFHTWFEKVSRKHSQMAHILTVFPAHGTLGSIKRHICCIFLAASCTSFERRNRHARCIVGVREHIDLKENYALKTRLQRALMYGFKLAVSKRPSSHPRTQFFKYTSTSFHSRSARLGLGLTELRRIYVIFLLGL